MRVLYHMPLSPCCRKARLLLAEKNLDFTLAHENIWDGRDEFFHLNPSGDVPVLVEQSGDVLCGNYAITEYLEELYPSPGFLGESSAERAEIRRLVDWFDVKFDAEVTQNLLFEKVYKRLGAGGSPDTQAIREGRRSVGYHMEYIAYLTSDKPWLVGERMTLADLAAGAQLSSIDYLADIHWSDYPKAREWYALLKSRPSFRALLADRVPGLRPPAYYENPDF